MQSLETNLLPCSESVNLSGMKTHLLRIQAWCSLWNEDNLLLSFLDYTAYMPAVIDI